MPLWPSDPRIPEWHKLFTGVCSRLRAEKLPNNSALARRDLASSRADWLRARDRASPCSQRLCRCAGQDGQDEPFPFH